MYLAYPFLRSIAFLGDSDRTFQNRDVLLLPDIGKYPDIFSKNILEICGDQCRCCYESGIVITVFMGGNRIFMGLRDCLLSGLHLYVDGDTGYS